jgi:PTH1 family peptidyl-tRNA hydrolase
MISALSSRMHWTVTALMSDLHLIVGLGNPGPRYENTRHNVGFRTVERLAARHGLNFSKQEFKAITASGSIAGKRVLLAKPQTYMNLSGEAVAPLVRFYKVPPERMIVVYDELDVPFGTLRLRKEGSSGGQNGIRHILQHMGTQQIARVRIGIGRPPGRMPPADWVLTPFKGDDAILAEEMIDQAANAIETWLAEGIERAMSRHNPPAAKPTPTPRNPVTEDEA